MSAGETKFIFPIRPLSNDRVALIPWKTTEHSKPFVELTKDYPELFIYLPWGPFPTVDKFHQWYCNRIATDPTQMIYAVFNKGVDGQPDEMTGMIGYLNSNADHAVLEIGCVITIPRFQRTHVTTNAVGLLLQYCLDSPPSGLGLRRVQWQANSQNTNSVRAAQRLGFTLEGIIRWQRVLADDCEGNGVDISHLPEINGKKLGPGRHSAMLSLCWDDWIEKRAALVAMMSRV